LTSQHQSFILPNKRVNFLQAINKRVNVLQAINLASLHQPVGGLLEKGAIEMEASITKHWRCVEAGGLSS